MYKKVFLLILLVTFCGNIVCGAEEEKKVEIFDNSISSVVKTFSSSSDIQRETSKIINNINGVYKKLDPIPKTGHMIKVPLVKPVTVSNEWFYHIVEEVIIILPQNEDPHLLLLDDEQFPHFFTFNHGIDDLLSYIDFDFRR
ncbi:hypothetical protein [Sutcliffiella cohnii]|uniref:hypothetical protein n=1 Tax=Sutcliffiella cohnii TaxID=33932 RepID=UPI002E1D849F|nr:hypothetical protein [Sutcliffiella cohnii]